VGASASRWGGGLRRRPSRWAWLVAISTLILTAVTVGMAVLWFVTWETRTTSYALEAAVSRVELDVGNGDVEVLGGGPLQVAVRSRERSAYGRSPRERRSVVDGVLRIESACPSIVLGSCAADYRLTVPDNVPVQIRERSGVIRMTSYRGAAELHADAGDIVVDAFCGFALSARTGAGNVRVSTVCSPELMDLQTGTGDVSVVVPPGRYRVDARTDTGDVDVEGIVPADFAPWRIQAVSENGDVRIEASS